MREQESNEKARQIYTQIQQEAENRIAQLTDENRRLRLELQKVQNAAEAQVAHVARQALEPDVGDDVQPQPTLKAPAHVKKAKLRNRQPRRISQYKEAVELDESANMPPT